MFKFSMDGLVVLVHIVKHAAKPDDSEDKQNPSVTPHSAHVDIHISRSRMITKNNILMILIQNE